MLSEHNLPLPLPNTDWNQGQGPSTNQNNRLPESPNGSEQSVEWNCSPRYSPDLNESQNPHYFNINKLLYEMYVERMNRGCHQI